MRFAAAALLFAFTAPALGDEPSLAELKALQGKWKLVDMTVRGKDRSKSLADQKHFMVFYKNVATTLSDDKVVAKLMIEVDPTKAPKTMDLTPEGRKMLQIYKLEGDKLTLCSKPGGKRPTQFSSTKENGQLLMVFERVKE